jgi:hypothetical protein
MEDIELIIKSANSPYEQNETNCRVKPKQYARNSNSSIEQASNTKNRSQLDVTACKKQNQSNSDNETPLSSENDSTSLIVYGAAANSKPDESTTNKNKPTDINNNLSLSKQEALNLAAANKSFESRQSFQIHQSMADRNQYDLYSREKDELFSFVCKGKHAEIVDSDYQDMDEIKPLTKDNAKLYELLIDDEPFCCTVHISDDLILLASQTAVFNLLKPNYDKWDFVRCILNPKFNGDDQELYVQGVKVLIDMCLDEDDNLILLNRWKCLETDKKQFTYKYTVELFDFNKKAIDGLRYSRTICSSSDEMLIDLNTTQVCLNNPRAIRNKESPAPKFTRVYNDEENNCIILVDTANNKINWYKKQNGSKKRCIKSVDNTLSEPRSLAFVDNNDTDIIFICSKSGLIASNKKFSINHELLMTLTDINYDAEEKCLFFIDPSNFYGGKLVKHSEIVKKKAANLGKPKLDRERTFSLEIEGKKGEEKSSKPLDNEEPDTLDLRYKYLLSFTADDKKRFKRIISTQTYIFILCEIFDDSENKHSIYAIDKQATTSI